MPRRLYYRDRYGRLREARDRDPRRPGLPGPPCLDRAFGARRDHCDRILPAVSFRGRAALTEQRHAAASGARDRWRGAGAWGLGGAARGVAGPGALEGPVRLGQAGFPLVLGRVGSCPECRRCG